MRTRHRSRVQRPAIESSVPLSSDTLLVSVPFAQRSVPDQRRTAAASCIAARQARDPLQSEVVCTGALASAPLGARARAVPCVSIRIVRGSAKHSGENRLRKLTLRPREQDPPRAAKLPLLADPPSFAEHLFVEARGRRKRDARRKPHPVWCRTTSAHRTDTHGSWPARVDTVEHIQLAVDEHQAPVLLRRREHGALPTTLHVAEPQKLARNTAFARAPDLHAAWGLAARIGRR
jgi:hypothetical protein